MLLGKGFNGTLRVGLETVYLTCLGSKGGSYQVSVSLDSPESSLATTVMVSRGSRVNIGQIVDSLNDKKRSVGIPKGASVQKKTGQNTHDYFLLAQ